MTNTIERQKCIAEILYSKLENFSSVILAGGAPRDWHLGNTANDLDFYVYHNPNNKSVKALLDNMCIEYKDLLLSLGLDFELKNPIFDGKGGWMFYEKNPNVLCVYEGLFENQSVQVVFMRHDFNISNLLDDFALDICQVAWKNDVFHTTQNFNEAVDHKIIRIVNNLYSDRDKYVQKIRNKFPKFLFLGKISSW